MTDDITRDCDGVAGGLARGGAGRMVRLSPVENLEARPHAVDRSAPRLELTTHFWATRKREITTILPVWDYEVDDHSAAAVREMVNTLECAYRAEHERCRAGHWAASVSRVTNIKYRLDLERALLTQLQATP